MDLNKTKLGVIFYQSDNGVEPVREWLRDLPRIDKKTIGDDVKTVQYGWPLGMPLVDSLGHGLWEVRSKISDGRIARVIFFMDDNAMILLHGFIKKTKTTPKPELNLAKRRKKQYEVNT